MIKLSDLDTIRVSDDQPCYLTHPSRSEESDDALLDAANQLELSKGYVKKWVLSFQSYEFLEQIDDIDDIEMSDFYTEFGYIW